MNRKRKTPVVAHLGEPLPLPYRPASAIKTEDENHDDSMETVLEVPRRRKFSPLGHRDRVLEETRLMSPRPLPVWHLRAVSWDHSPAVNVLPSLVNMERRIGQIREEFRDADEAETKQLERKLEGLDRQLEEILEQRHEHSLVEELERLQQLNPRLRRGGAAWVRYAAAAAVAVLLAASFCVGQLLYDYCYYFC